jgi:hypothetical protein
MSDRKLPEMQPPPPRPLPEPPPPGWVPPVPPLYSAMLACRLASDERRKSYEPCPVCHAWPGEGCS